MAEPRLGEVWRGVGEALGAALHLTNRRAKTVSRGIARALYPPRLYRTLASLRREDLRRGVQWTVAQYHHSVWWRTFLAGGALTVVVGPLLWLAPRLPKQAPPLPAKITGVELNQLAQEAEPPPPEAGLHVLARVPEGDVATTQDGIKVLFDHSMVAMTDVDPDKHPSIPLTIDPPIPGEFVWFGTKGFLYRFAQPLTPATRYTVTLPQGLAALDGKSLDDAVTWRFTTPTPSILRSEPREGQEHVPPRTPVRLTFTQPMQRAAVEAALQCDQWPQENAKTQVPQRCATKFQYRWETDEKGREVLIATPQQPYQFGMVYRIELPKGLPPAVGTLGTASGLSLEFSTSAAMELETVDIAHPYPAADDPPTRLYERPTEPPATGAAKQKAESRLPTRYPTGDLCFSFSNPIDRRVFESAVQVVPRGKVMPDPTFRVGFYYEDEVATTEEERAAAVSPQDLPHLTACVTADLKYDTEYELRFARPVLDRDGQPVNLKLVRLPLRFTTMHAGLEGQLTVTKPMLNAKVLPTLPFSSINAEKVEVRVVPCQRHRLSDIVMHHAECAPEEEDAEEEEEAADDEEGDSESPDAFGAESAPKREDPWTKTVPIEAEYDTYHHGRIDLAGLFPQLKPGIYEVRATFHPMSEITLKRKVKTLGIEHEALVTTDPVTHTKRLLLTETALALKRFENQFMVWAVDIQSGAPRAQLPIQVWDDEHLLATGWTDAQGLFRFTGNSVWPNATLLVVADDPRAVSYLHSDDDEEGIAPEDFGLRYGRPWFVHNYFAYLHTDRPLYRPTQPVYFAGVLRGVRDGVYRLAAEVETIDVVIRDAEGTEIYEQVMPVSPTGTFGDTITLGDDDIPRGRYWIEATLPTLSWEGENERRQIFRQAFYVASYRKPDLALTLTPESVDVVSGQPLRLTATGRYIFGAPLAKAEIEWSVRQEGFCFAPAGFSEFSFVDEEAIHRSRDEAEGVSVGAEDDDEGGYDTDRSEVLAGVMATDSHDRTDDPKVKPERSGGPSRTGIQRVVLPARDGALGLDGLLAIEHTPDLTALPTSQLYTATVTVKEWGQEVSAVTDLRVHKADAYVGLKAARQVVERAGRIEIALQAVTSAAKPLAQHAVQVGLYKRDYMTVKRRTSDGEWVFVSEPKDTLVERTTVTTDARGAATYARPVTASGDYRIAAEISDARGNTNTAAVIVPVSGSDAAWQQRTDDRIALLPDRARYRVGETAQLLIPFDTVGARALVTIERAGVRETQLLDFAPGENLVRVPIREEYVPNIYVGVLLFRPHGLMPAVMKVGMAELAVEPDQKRLAVTITPDRPHYAPKDRVRLQIRTVDHTGKGVTGDVMVSVADESVLRLLDYQSPDLVRRFYFPRLLGVRTAENMLRYKSGDGGEGADLAKKKRNKFLDTAHWATVRTDAGGTATVEFTLPDNITTWVAEALAITDDTKVGSTFTTFRSRLPIFVRPSFPRFLAVEDRARPLVFIENTGDAPFAGQLQVRAANEVTFVGTTEFPLTIPPGERATLGLDAIGTAPGTGTVTLTVRDAQHAVTDLLEQVVPVHDRSIPSVAAAVGATRGTAVEQLAIDRAVRADRGGLEVTIGTTPFKLVSSAMEYLLEYPYGCAEQRTSAILALWQLLEATPEVGHADALPRLLADVYRKHFPKAPQPPSREFLRGQIARALGALYAFQRGDGGFNFWREDKVSEPFLSAEIARALALWRTAGITVNADITKRLTDYLQALLARQQPLTPPKPGVTDRRGYEADSRAMLVWGLASLDPEAAEPAMASLLEVDDLLSPRGLAPLLLAQAAMGEAGDRGTQRGLAKRLRKYAVMEKAEQGDRALWQDPNKVIDPTTLTALVVQALAAVDNNDEHVQAGLRHLLHFARRGHFGHTRATREVMLALWQVGRAGESGQGTIPTTVRIGADTRQAALGPAAWLHDVRPMSELVQLTEPLTLRIEKPTTSSSALYYHAVLTSYLPIAQVPRREDGIIVAREFYAMDDVAEAHPLTQFTLGESYKATLTVMTQRPYEQLVVEHLLPAGLEPVDFSLATANPELAQAMQESAEAEAKSPILTPSEFGHEEIHDDRVMWAAPSTSRGIYKLRHVVRATTAGTFQAPGASAFPFYATDYFGRSRSMEVEVKDTE